MTIAIAAFVLALILWLLFGAPPPNMPLLVAG
ncbi:hypothetical protein J2X12_002921 [Pseudarthrobacter oxydans]|uniref:Uncharacterized protein n=1 Tax=Pseudarthrobacter oxydans TaxID=1671 RepID=A0AAW8NG35_PSEOX|nr:hypothetical protein [Pseudarthrobacter oxydans]MDR7164883.1 hypothetical protein [Pseudarthrobacter oxydans]